MARRIAREAARESDPRPRTRYGDGSIATGCTLLENGAIGLDDGFAGIVAENVARGNGGIGIDANAGIASENIMYGNGGHGLRAGSGVAQRNVSRGNAGYGFVQGGAYRANNVTGNGSGTVFNGLDAGANACDGTTTCP